MSAKKQSIIVIVGPTASGKTALSLMLARALGGEIVSADSRQIYRGLDIGTGKVTKEEMGDIPHHLIDIRNPEEAYSAADFAMDAGVAIEGIAARGNIPIIVGGTFFYIEALLGRKQLPAVPPNMELRATLEAQSTAELFTLLEAKDPARAATIDAKNKRRLVRALEIAHALGSVPAPQDADSPYDAYIIGIDMPKEVLHDRIGVRLHERIAAGMVEEAERLHAEGLSFERMDELGLEYRYLARYLHGDMPETAMVQELEKEIRHFAKRQMTWLKKMEGVQWYRLADTDTIKATVERFLD